MDDESLELRPRGRLTLASLGLLSLGVISACGQSDNHRNEPSTTAGAGAGGTGAGGAAVAGATNGGSSGAINCDGAAPPLKPASGRLELPIALRIGANSAAIGVPAAGPDGRELNLSLFKLFLTQPVLIDASGQEAAGQIVDAGGQPLPYGVQLVDVDDALTQVWRIAVADGAYTKLRFGVGVPSGCNAPSGTSLVYPLNPDSEMYWTWGAQFLFVRIEGMTRAAATQAFEPFLYHVGFDPAFAHISVEGTLTVRGASTGPTLVLDVARMLATEAAALPEPQHAVPDGWVADNLENNRTFSLE